MIRLASSSDLKNISELDKHISFEELRYLAERGRLIVSEKDGRTIGWLRFGLFWDNTPFMNMLYIIDGERGKGHGSALCDFWESEMRSSGFDLVLTSTLSSEQAQHFYRKRGYKDCGSLLMPSEPLEIILLKELNPHSFDACE